MLTKMVGAGAAAAVLAAPATAAAAYYPGPYWNHRPPVTLHRCPAKPRVHLFSNFGCAGTRWVVNHDRIVFTAQNPWDSRGWAAVGIYMTQHKTLQNNVYRDRNGHGRKWILISQPPVGD
jgi:hypothetical protein